ncbi:MAG TPA: hypothetical protein PKA28_09630 [Methylomusa anaerophila]|uniref:Lactonase, 7-bladed beta-propeller n=1 Tax=Methylomusa anaerophila TaxID=1930071 RepID=A0A348AI00_9FIRM|nr:hypothetical protein [Methylomusa anaerophila]BBB90698.1 hypothetical protein MAMMFC1_01359 [Methylomusa anaerophila]HML88699.1 hypothetical protein [Methylomusa anaerophila]
MGTTAYKLLVIDGASHTLLAVDGPSGKILHELSFPPDYTPTDIAVNIECTRAYLPAASTSGNNVIFAVDLKDYSLSRLSISIPYPAQFTLSPDNDYTAAYLTDPAGTLYRLDLKTMTLAGLGTPGTKASCVGLATDNTALYSAWEHESGGTVAVFSLQGRLVWQRDVAGIPTNIILDSGRCLLVPFTNTAFTGEGVVLFNIARKNLTTPTVITVQCPSCPSGLAAYPCHAAVPPDGKTAYIASEDSSSVIVLDLASARIIDRFVIGRSISRLYLIPDSHLAIASSNLFGDLCCIDLNCGELLSVTATNRQLLSYIAVLPAGEPS